MGWRCQSVAFAHVRGVLSEGDNRRVHTTLRAFSPSHLNDFLECEHLAALGIAVARGELARPDADDPQAELIRRKGIAHEHAYLAQLRADGKSILQIDTDDRDWERAA